jgi:hypothetical protein
MSVMVFEPVSLRASPALRVDEAALASVTAIDESSNVGQEVSRVDCRRVRLLRRRLPGRLRLGESPSIEASPQSLHCLPDDRAEITVGHLRSHQGAQPLEVVANLRIRGELDLVPGRRERLENGKRRGAGRGASGRDVGGWASTAPGASTTQVTGLSGSFRMTEGTSGRGSSSATISSIWRLDLRTVRASSACRFSRVRTGASLAIPLRWSRPSASISKRMGCSRAALATVMRSWASPSDMCRMFVQYEKIEDAA